MPRRPLDLYETPKHYVMPLLRKIGSLQLTRVYEPCVGMGHISRFLRPVKYLRTNDIDRNCSADSHFDAADINGRAWGTYFDWTITNPPFSLGLEIAQAALKWSHNVALLHRLSFLEPTLSRSEFWQEHPPTDVIILPRYSFRLNDDGKRQTDNVTCCWIIWQEDREPCLTFIPHLKHDR